MSQTKDIYILGISAFYHDSAACLIKNGQIIAAAQEERFTRRKHDADFPRQAVDYCLRAGGITAVELDYVGFYEKPFIKFERLLFTYLSYAPRGLRSFLKAMPVWMKEKLFIKSTIQETLGYDGPIVFPEHHESHAAAAFFPSPFERAAILTMDGVGEWATTSYGRGQGGRIELLADIRFPHSLGLLYSAFTYYCGFRVNSGEYKLMGLAPYGRPQYVDQIKRHLIDIKPDGSFRMNMRYFNFCAGLTMTNARFHALFGGPPRRPEDELDQRHMDVARSIQVVTEEIMLAMAAHVQAVTGEENLCLAGGVALNCVGNGRILREGPFKRIWIQPAAGDAGGALGAALFVWHQHLNQPRRAADGADAQQGSYLGPSYSDDQLREFLDGAGIPYEELAAADLPERVAGLIDDQQVVGLFSGRMEFGPRALGARSIIADARSPVMQEVLNLKIKFRESFRPFAPSVLAEARAQYFDLNEDSPYMLLVAPIKEGRIVPESRQTQRAGLDQLKVCRSEIPAVTHVDYSARVQTVTRATHPVYYDIIQAFARRTGCPVIINTSFNVRGEPIVCRPEEAYRCFMRTGMDYLLLGRFLLNKAQQPRDPNAPAEPVLPLWD